MMDNGQFAVSLGTVRARPASRACARIEAIYNQIEA